MPVVAAPLFGFALGAIFAWAGADEISRVGGSVTSRSLVVVTLFGFLVFAPACGYFQAFFPDWSYAYFLDAERRPVALDFAFVVLDGLSAPIGLAALSRSAAARRSGAVARAATIPSVVAFLFLLAMLSRLRVFANYAQFHGDFGTESLSGSPVGYALVWMAGVVAAATAWTLHVLRRLADPANVN